MKKPFLLIGLLFIAILISGCSHTESPASDASTNALQNSNTNTQAEINPILCSTDADCLLSTTSNDSNLQPHSFLGKKGTGVDAENVQVACVSKDYFTENENQYGLDDNVWTGSESDCRCKENQCQEEVHGIIPSPQINVSISNFAFSPATLTITAGKTVTWTNNDSAPHLVASDPHPAHTDLPGFESENLSTGQSYSYTFTEKGTHTYHCHLHPSMKGTIIVE